MLNTLAKLLLTSTAIAPVLLTYCWVAVQAEYYRLGIALSLGCAALVTTCVLLLRYAKRNLERVDFAASSVESADRENMAFVLFYLWPLFTTQFTQLATPNWQAWVPALIIFAAIVGTGYSYHFNPLLGLMGWHFYKVGTKEGITYVLITKRQLRKATEAMQVGQLTEYVILDVGEK